MANKLYNDTSIKAIADAIRVKNGKTDTYTVGEMAGAISSLSGKESVTWHQCPEAPRNFINNVTYDPNDYSTSQIENYAPATPLQSNTKPIGKTVDGVTYYNEVPNIETPFASTNAAGTLKPLDKLRWIMNGANNMRDLGGWSCDGGIVKYGMLFRGAELNEAMRPVMLDELGIKHDLSLRGKSEATWEESKLGPGIHYFCYDTYIYYSLENKEAWKANLQYLFDAVKYDEPLYFHCSIGCDRTGTFAAIVEAILGVSQSDIDKDYELSSFYTGTDTDANARRRNESQWTGLIGEINNITGSTFRDKVINFVASLGISADDINEFRSKMIEGTPEIVTPTVTAYTITNSITKATSDNVATTANSGTEYIANINPLEGGAIQSVIVKMGGVDITDSVWSGEFTPFGNTTITENGTYDVTQFASAVVNVPSAPSGATNCKRWTVTLSSDAPAGWNTFVTSDSDVASHYADITAFAIIQAHGSWNNAKKFLSSISGNVESKGYYGSILRGTDTAIVCATVPASLSSGTAGANQLCADASGNINLFNSTSYPILADTYDIIFFW